MKMVSENKQLELPFPSRMAVPSNSSARMGIGSVIGYLAPIYVMTQVIGAGLAYEEIAFYERLGRNPIEVAQEIFHRTDSIPAKFILPGQRMAASDYLQTNTP